MDELARKLQYKENFECLILNKPAEFTFVFSYDSDRIKDEYSLELIFVHSMEELNTSLPTFLKPNDDRLRWIAYPKKSSSIASDLNRDIIWKQLVELSYKPVAMISLNETWSAMRIRHQDDVNTIAKEKTSMPEELQKLLEGNPECRDYYNTLSATNKIEYMRWIQSAKRIETKENRLAKTKLLLQDKIPNPYSGR